MNSFLLGNTGGARTHFCCTDSRRRKPQLQHGLKSNSVALSWLYSHDLLCVHLWSSLRAAPRHSTKLGIPAVASSYTPFTLPAKDLVQVFATTFKRVFSSLDAHPVLSSCVPPIAMIIFAIYGLVPCVKLIRQSIFKRKSWESSQVKHIVVSYVRPLLLWMGIISICRTVDPVVLSNEASQAIKDRSVNFIKSLSTVLTFAVCTTNLTQHIQKSIEKPDADKGRNLGVQFISNAVCTSVWVAAVCLFMELLGFSTQKWITAGGLGTVLVTLAGREIFTNFLSSIMLHATRPFVESQWIQTKIEGQEVSGTVEHLGWWSPTVIRGDDREAVHIPNHKFTVSVVRNLSQKTHWRIKTHLAISHLDASKIAYIVADMRKVLAKHSQVEQKRLHRRVFLDYIHPENQSLHVLVSCFVKTSHFEEYLRVKEIILLDLLRVVSHHNARLATPIRSIHRVTSDDPQQAPPHKFDRPLFIGESSVLSAAEQQQFSRVSEDDDDAGDIYRASKQQLEGLDSMGLNSNDITLLGAAFGKPLVKIRDDVSDDSEEFSRDEEGDEGIGEETQEGSSSRDEEVQIIRGKIYVQDDVKEQIVGSIRGGGAEGNKMPLVEENLVLGLALDGSKRTLPLDKPQSGEGGENTQEQATADARERER